MKMSRFPARDLRQRKQESRKWRGSSSSSPSQKNLALAGRDLAGARAASISDENDDESAEAEESMEISFRSSMEEEVCGGRGSYKSVEASEED